MQIFIIVISILFFAAVGVIAYDSNRFVVRKITVPCKRAEEEGSFLVISDLHNKSYGKENARLYKALEKIDVDAAFLPGDIMNSAKTDEFSEAVRLIDYLNSRVPVFYSYGNHESRTRNIKRIYGDMFERFEVSLSETGVKLLDNESKDYGDLKITALTLPEKYYYKKRKQRLTASDIEDYVGKKDKRKFTVLLAHDPEYFDAYAEYGADLVLAGHFHGGIIRLFGHGVISPRYKLFPAYSGGVYKKDKTTMVVSCGLGSHTIPFRLFNPGEILILTLKAEA